MSIVGGTEEKKIFTDGKNFRDRERKLKEKKKKKVKSAC